MCWTQVCRHVLALEGIPAFGAGAERQVRPPSPLYSTASQVPCPDRQSALPSTQACDPT